MGSTPGERINTKGEVLVESRNVPSKSKGGGSMYFCPRSLATNWEMVGTNLSSRSTRKISIF